MVSFRLRYQNLVWKSEFADDKRYQSLLGQNILQSLEATDFQERIRTKQGRYTSLIDIF